MSNYIIGISAFYHDSAACILKDGRILAASQEERFSRIKHDSSFPVASINYCLEEANIEFSEVDAIGFYDDPVLTFDRIVSSSVKAFPESKKTFSENAISFLRIKPRLSKLLFDAFQSDKPIFYCKHHYSHAASAFFPSPFEDSAVICVDGVGEWCTTSISLGERDKISMVREIHFPHSLGILYSAFTHFCGFKVNSGEYKLMGLAPYGDPIYVNKIKENIIDIKQDGSFRLNMEYFNYEKSNTLLNENFYQLFDGIPRNRESKISIRELNLASSIQMITEEVMLKLSMFAKKQLNTKNLCLAGGVALNCVSNGKILSESLFDNMWIQPASGDAGGSLGAAYLTYLKYAKGKLPKKMKIKDMQKGSLLGPRYTNSEIINFLTDESCSFKKELNDDTLTKEIAQIISKGKVVALFRDRMEFGPRALGARSILGDPRSPDTQSRMNLKIKFRESFRPFAPIVLKEDAHKYFELNEESPYMLLVSKINDNRRKHTGKALKKDDLLKIVNQVRSDIPAVTHVDYSSRVQTVSKESNLFLYKILKHFKKLTGCSVLVNTSFNVRGEPIVCSPRDAYRCFLRTDIDYLVMENTILNRKEQNYVQDDESWKNEFELD
ncbi:MAG: hypothetical protein CBB97_10520 [Candidatus Endolissoclinum sp. TMED37]|nr:MAG: hypothetical protein CBB97_10520 [Candidatus Endolissoclinum sp. TMED37]